MLVIKKIQLPVREGDIAKVGSKGLTTIEVAFEGFLNVSLHAAGTQLGRRRRSSLWLPKLFGANS